MLNFLHAMRHCPSTVYILALLVSVTLPIKAESLLTDQLEQVSNKFNLAITYPKAVTDQYNVSKQHAVANIQQALTQLLTDTPFTFEVSTHGVLIFYADNTAELPPLAPTSKAIEEVKLVASVLDSQSKIPNDAVSGFTHSLTHKKQSFGFSDSLVSATIATTPQQNLAEAIQRMPGLSVERDKGLATKVNLRGLPSNFSHVSVNGIATATNSSDREIEFDMFTPEMVQQVTVKKSLTAADVEGGISGNIKVITARPYSQTGNKFNLSINQAYNSISAEFDPAASVIAYEVFDQVAALISLSHSIRTNRTDSHSDVAFRPLSRWLEKTGTAQAQIQSDQAASVLLRDTGISISDDFDRNETDRVVFINKVGDRAYLSTQEKWSANTALQFKPSPHFTASFDLLAGTYDTAEDTYDASAYSASSTSTLEQIHQFDQHTLASDNIVVLTDASYTNTQHELLSKQALSNSTYQQVSLDLDWQYLNYQNKVLLGYSDVARNTEYTNLKYTAYGPSRSRYTDFGGEVIPSANANSFNMYTSPDLYHFDHYDIDQETVEDQQLTMAYESIIWPQIKPIPWLAKVHTGVRYTRKRKGHEQGSGRITETVTGASAKGSILTNYDINEIANLVPGGAYHQINDSVLSWHQVSNQSARALFYPSGLKLPSDKEQYYRINEEVLNLFAMADIEFEYLDLSHKLNLGVRFADTNVTSHGFQQLQNANGEVSYLDQTTSEAGGNKHFLPSASWVSYLTEDLLLKWAYSKTLIRPSLNQLAYRSSVDLAELKYREGSPDLKPTYAAQWELGLEWYFAPQALLALSYFHKDISGIIRETQTGVVTDVTKYNNNGSIDGVYDFTVYQHINAKNAYVIKGVEFLSHLPMREITPLLEQFYFNVSYTYLDNELSAESDLTIISAPEGLADNSLNLSLYYHSNALDVNLSYNYKGAYVENIERDKYPVYRDSYGQFDLAVAYQLSENIELFFKGINVTNQTTSGYTMSPKFPTMLEHSGRRFALGVNLTL